VFHLEQKEPLTSAAHAALRRTALMHCRNNNYGSPRNVFFFPLIPTKNSGTDRPLMNFHRQRGWVEVHMNRHDRELLDRQMRRFQPSPHPVGLMMLILTGAFLVGMIAGSIFTSQQPVQTASTDGRTALAFLLNGSRSEPR
jgi:hypothetical protein